MKFPWEDQPALPAVPVEKTVEALQRDVAFMVQYTAILVRSQHDALSILVNTPRGQIIPRGACTLTDGSTVEFQDIGMPQPGAETMTVEELTGRIWDITYRVLGLGVQP